MLQASFFVWETIEGTFALIFDETSARAGFFQIRFISIIIDFELKFTSLCLIAGITGVGVRNFYLIEFHVFEFCANSFVFWHWVCKTTLAVFSVLDEVFNRNVIFIFRGPPETVSIYLRVERDTHLLVNFLIGFIGIPAKLLVLTLNVFLTNFERGSDFCASVRERPGLTFSAVHSYTTVGVHFAIGIDIKTNASLFLTHIWSTIPRIITIPARKQILL